MSKQVTQMLKKAQQLIKAKRRDDARNLLLKILQHDETVVEAYWLWALAASSPDEAREALNEVLRLDPGHSKAKRRLDQLNERYPTEQAAAPPPPPRSSAEDLLVPLAEEAAPPRQSAPADEPLPPATPKKAPKKRSGSMGTTIMFVLIGVVMVGAIVLIILSQVQIGPCPASEWLARFEEASSGMSRAIDRMIAAGNAKSDSYEDRRTAVEAYRDAIRGLGGPPCVRGVSGGAIAYINASITAGNYAKDGNTSLPRAREDAKNAEQAYRDALRDLRDVAANETGQ